MGIERGDNERGLGNQWGLSGETMKEVQDVFLL